MPPGPAGEPDCKNKLETNPPAAQTPSTATSTTSHSRFPVKPHPHAKRRLYRHLSRRQGKAGSFVESSKPSRHIRNSNSSSSSSSSSSNCNNSSSGRGVSVTTSKSKMSKSGDSSRERHILRESSPRLVEVTLPLRTPTPTPTQSEPLTRGLSNPLFTTFPLIRDLLCTKTSVDQDEVARACIKLYSEPLNFPPHLNREAHIEFLEEGLGIDEDGYQLPPQFVALDASRPWILYWCLIGLYELGADLALYRERLIETLRPIQNYYTGGFGGGNGQTSHVAVSYAAVLALCTVGGRDAFELIDRIKMWKWLSGLKQVDGGFMVCERGEEDVRGVYCALTLISLLGLPTELAPEDIIRLKRESQEIQSGMRTGGWNYDPTQVPQNLLDGVPEYLSRCQTYEGGIAGGPGGMEAHGGYAFCALAALCLLGDAHVMLKKHLDLPRLIAWLSARQYAPEGGFSGRTNKLVDGCYSTWVGGCWALVEAALNGPPREEDEDEEETDEDKITKEKGRPVVGSIWSRDGLVRYILTCCQSPFGGLRDKPGKHPDFYHSGYTLLGLSSAQNYQYYVHNPTSDLQPHTPQPVPTDPDKVPSPPTALRAAFSWRTSHYIPTHDSRSVIERVMGTFDAHDSDMIDYLDIKEDDGVGESLGDAGEWWNGDRVRRAHPVFNVPFEMVKEWERWVWVEQTEVVEGDGQWLGVGGEKVVMIDGDGGREGGEWETDEEQRESEGRE